MDFTEIKAAGKDEQIRAWSVEEAGHRLGFGASGKDIINVAKMFEDFVKTGDVSNVITAAVEEGYREGRFQVKQAAEEALLNPGFLDDLFVTEGWMDRPVDPAPEVTSFGKD